MTITPTIPNLRRGDNKVTVTLRLSHRGQRAYIPTYIIIEPGQWDVKARKVVRHPRMGMLNNELQRLVFDCQDAALAIAKDVRLADLTARQLADMIDKRLHPCAAPMLCDELNRLIERARKPSTASSFRSTVSRLNEYTGDIMLGEVTHDWLDGFDRWLETHGCPRAASRSIHLRNIRTAFNAAINAGRHDTYPFRGFRIRSGSTPDRSLTVGQMKELVALDLEGLEAAAREVFLLSFALIGCNMADMWDMHELGARTRYTRKKTGKEYSIKTTPAIRRYWPALDSLRRYKSPHIATCRINILLNNIGKRIGIPALTMYWARHSWASIAAINGVPTEVIAKALGHSGSTVTHIYIDVKQGDADAANELVSRLVFG